MFPRREALEALERCGNSPPPFVQIISSWNGPCSEKQLEGIALLSRLWRGEEWKKQARRLHFPAPVSSMIHRLGVNLCCAEQLAFALGRGSSTKLSSPLLAGGRGRSRRLGPGRQPRLQPPEENSVSSCISWCAGNRGGARAGNRERVKKKKKKKTKPQQWMRNLS